MTARGRPGGSSLKIRRQARAAFFAACRLVEREFKVEARPRPGRQRMPGRPLAIHAAAEAFDLRPFEIGPAARLNRRRASEALSRVWLRREADTVFDARMAHVIELLRGET